MTSKLVVGISDCEAYLLRSPDQHSDVTHILQAIENGDAQAARVLPLVYQELRRLAAHKMASSAGSYCNRRHWCMKPGSTSAVISNRPGKIARISSARPRKPCGASSWIGLVRSWR